MLSIGNLFIIEEGVFEDTKEALSKYFRSDKISDFIGLSQKVVKNKVGSLTEREKVYYRGLFEDPEVRDYINAARRAGERDGWIRGGLIGGALGGGIGSAAGTTLAIGSEFGPTAFFVSFITLGLLGAAAGGALVGYTFSRILSWLRKWKAEDAAIELGKVGGKVGKTIPVVTPLSDR